MQIDLSKGRLNRKKFLVYLLIIGLIFTAYTGVFTYLKFHVIPVLLGGSYLEIIFDAIGLIPWIACIVFLFSLIVRRLHDLGHSGSWMLLLFIEFVFLGFSSTLVFYGIQSPLLAQALVIINLILFLLEIIFILYLFVKKGQSETNLYGKVN